MDDFERKERLVNERIRRSNLAVLRMWQDFQLQSASRAERHARGHAPTDLRKLCRAREPDAQGEWPKADCAVP